MYQPYKQWEEQSPEYRSQVGLDNYRGYGRKDVVLAGYPDRHTRHDFESAAEMYSTTPEALQAAYEQARQEAEQEKQQNLILFYLHELLIRMGAGDEWYGSDFEKPMWMVQQVIDALEKKER